MQDLKDWLHNNKILCAIEDNLITVPNFGTVVFINDKKGKLFENESSKNKSTYYFILTDEEYDQLEQIEEITHIAFKWGSRFFYCKKESQKNEYNELIYLPEFNSLVNIGDYQTETEIEGGFVNLGVHTGYELLNGSREPIDWVKKAKFFKHQALGISDKNTLAGTLAFQLDCDKLGIKPILGATYSVAYNYDKDALIQETFDIKLYVKNYEGWRNLLRINKEVKVTNPGFIIIKDLLKFSDGLICVFPKFSYLNSLIDDEVKFIKHLETTMEYFEDFYYQIDLNEMSIDSVDMDNLKTVKKYMDNYSDLIPPVVINDSYYVEQIDNSVKKILNKIDSFAQHESDEQYFKDACTILDDSIYLLQTDSSFNIFVEGLENTNRLASKCDFRIDVGNHKLPKFPVKNPEELYYDLIAKGMEDRILSKYEDEDLIEEYFARIEEENDVIVGAGFVDYFLILWDIVKWAKEQNILVGSGRGSAGGSLVAYLLGITDIDPIEYDLLFERFLNKARVSGERAKSADSLPDIDVDFESARRNEVKRYVDSKYGVDNVCSIGTYSRMKVKSAIKDFAKVEGVSFQDVNFATKEIPDSIKSYWKDIFDNAIIKPKLKAFVNNNAEVIENIQGVLGQPKSGSVHASAILILPTEDEHGNPMTGFDWLPIKKVDGILVSEWEGKYVDRAGFLKEDILGLSQLDKFQSIITWVDKNHGYRPDLTDIPVDVDYVYEFFQNGWNEDVFQFGTSGLKSYSKKVRPDTIEDLISMNALFRPGPMELSAHEDFAKIKHGKKKAKFDPFMKTITKKTNGLFVFQEQIMQAMVVGGLTLAEADQVRTYMKKFDDKSMSTFKDKFIDIYVKKLKKNEDRNPEETAQKVWDKLYAFSAYGFNRSHAAAYTLMGYWCQFLKVHYPLEFWTASLNFADEKVEMPNRLAEINKINSVSDEEIKVMPPDVNKSNREFTPDSDTSSIYWSLTKIKHAGEVAVSEILRVRTEGGEFFSIEEFLNRVTKSKVNKRIVTNLIKAGAFDQIEFGNGDFIGDEPKGRWRLLQYYYTLIKSDIEDGIAKSSDVEKNWFWISLQREITGFGEINYGELLKRATKQQKFVKTYMAPEILDSWKDPMKGRRKRFDNGHDCTIAGRMVGVYESIDKNQDVYYKFMIESNNTIIAGVAWKDEAKKMGKQLMELDQTKEMFAIYGAISYDDFRATNVFKVTKDSKIIKI